MGSCSNKAGHHHGGPIKTEIITVNKEVSQPEHEDNKHVATVTPTPRNHLSVPIDPQAKSNSLENSRKTRKNLTVLATNNDEIEIPKDMSLEQSFKAQYNESKIEQGSLMVIREPITIGGRPSTNKQTNFEEKLTLIQGDNVKTEFLLEQGLWVCCKKGMKPEQPNQDDFVVVVENSNLLFGVFDGHGSHGHHISNFVHEHIPRLLFQSAYWTFNPLAAYLEAFPKAHKDLLDLCALESTPFDCTLSGCTSTVITIRDSTLYVAHVGDSRAVLGKRKGNNFVAVDLTEDHKPELFGEKIRIEQSGGEVIRLEGDIPVRVFKKGKNYPGIAMSRAIGDLIAQTVGVSHVPDVKELALGPEDEFLIACSDGVWEFISSQGALDEVAKHDNPKSAAEALAKQAWDEWVKNEGDVVDDITVIVVFLKRR